MRTIRVLLADDHDLFRAGVRALLQERGFEVVAEAGDGREVLRLLQEHRPDVVLMDLLMPGLNGLEATGRITREFPGVRVLVLSMSAAEEFVLPVLRAGASGYLLKNTRPDDLEKALRAVARGETYLAPAVSGFLVEDYRRRTAGTEDPLDRLSPRQREVLQLVAEGETDREIAAALFLSPRTVNTHVANILAKLGVASRRDAAAWARAHGVLPASDHAPRYT